MSETIDSKIDVVLTRCIIRKIHSVRSDHKLTRKYGNCSSVAGRRVVGEELCRAGQVEGGATCRDGPTSTVCLRGEGREGGGGSVRERVGERGWQSV